MALQRPITYDKVFYEVNEEEGLDPYCHECTSHKGKAHNGTIVCRRDSFRFLHKWVYWDVYGEIPEVVEHRCGNKCCINPDHLVGLTVEEAKKLDLPAAYGRPPKAYGSMYRTAVSPEKLVEIRKMLADGHTHIEIGRKLGVSYRIVKGIKMGTIYNHE